jgi:hypothetical protein
LWTWRVAGTVDSHRLMSLRFLARTRRAKTVAVATIVDYLGGLALPDRAADGRLFPAVDVTCWLRPDAHTAPERILRHTYGRGKDQHIMIPGWPYSFVVALQTGRSSRTAPLDAVRLAPADDGYPTTDTRRERASAPSRDRVHLRRSGQLGRPGRGHHRRHPPPRASQGTSLGPAAPAANPLRRLPHAQTDLRLDLPKDPHPARGGPVDRLILAVYTQLRLARPLTADLRRPWQTPAPPRPTPARVRRGFGTYARRSYVLPAHLNPRDQHPAGHPAAGTTTPLTPRHDVHAATGLTSEKAATTKRRTKKSVNPRPRRTG